jgi:hypothetical protein
VTVNKERVELFVAALESDEYKQCTEFLRRNTDDGETQHCGLGVATEVALLHEPALRTIEPYFLWFRSDLHEAVAAWYGFDNAAVQLADSENGSDWVGGWNDDGATFWEIAQAVRAKYLKD